MKIQNQYMKAGSLYLFGNIFNKGIAFLTVPIFTRILSTYDYGIINTYFSWVGILSIILGMALHMGVRAGFTEYEEKIDDFMSSVTSLVIINSFMISVIILSGIILFKVNVEFILVALCLIQGFSSALISNYSMYLIMKYKYKAQTLLLIFPNLMINLISIFLIIIVFESDKYMGKILPSSMITLIFALISVLFIYKNNKKILITKYWKFALAISLPLILHGLSLTILSQSDRIMLTMLADPSATGVYSLIYNFSMISIVVSVSLEGVWVPWFTQCIRERKIELINNRVKLYIGIMTFVTIGIILISPEILVLISPQEYWIGIGIIPPIVISSYIMFIYTIYVNVEHFHKQTKHIAFNTVIAATCNVILNYIFIPRYGMYAAAATTLIAYLLSLSMHYRYSKSIESELFPYSIFINSFKLLLITTFLFYLLLPFPIIRWVILFFVFCYAFFKWKLEILSFIVSK